MAQIDTNNSLLTFMSEATINLQQALTKQGKAKKINHRKYITKRLQQGGKGSRVNSTKPKPAQQQQQRVAAPAVPPSSATASLPSWESACVSDLAPFSAYDYYQNPPSAGYTATPYPSPPTTTAQEFDPDLEELLTEIGLDSPSQCSQYSCVSSPASLTRGATVCQAPPTSTLTYNTYMPSTDILDNLPSDFSDIDESYPSSRSVSPSYYSPRTGSPQCSNHQLYGSYEWVPIHVAPSNPPPAPSSPSLNELLSYFPEHCYTS